MKKKSVFRIIFFLFGLIISGLLIGYLIWNEPRPEGISGKEADALAREMMAAVNEEGWAQTGAVSWTFRDRNTHLWDRKRHFSQVEWGDKRVLVDINNRRGVAFVKGEMITGEAGDKLVDKAWKNWVNDAFWLNPVVKMFDPGTMRYLVTTESGERGVMVSYQSGGATPGDSYLWIPGEDGLPKQWKMWVSILPIGGLAFTWEDWLELPTGARIAQMHKGPGELRMNNVQGDSSLQALRPGPDPFEALVNAYPELKNK